MLENIRGHSRGSIPPLRMPSPLPHDLCHEWNVSRRLPARPQGRIAYLSPVNAWEILICSCFNSVSLEMVHYTVTDNRNNPDSEYIIAAQTTKLGNPLLNEEAATTTSRLQVTPSLPWTTLKNGHMHSASVPVKILESASDWWNPEHLY